jgi:hypothetical protein
MLWFLGEEYVMIGLKQALESIRNKSFLSSSWVYTAWLRALLNAVNN